MPMVPNERNYPSVIIFKCIVSDNPSIGTSHVSSGGPSAKVVFSHFESVPPFLYYQFLPIR